MESSYAHQVEKNDTPVPDPEEDIEGLPKLELVLQRGSTIAESTAVKP